MHTMFCQFTFILVAFTMLPCLTLVSATIEENQSVCYSTDYSHAQRNYYSMDSSYPQISEHVNYNIKGISIDAV